MGIFNTSDQAEKTRTGNTVLRAIKEGVPNSKLLPGQGRFLDEKIMSTPSASGTTHSVPFGPLKGLSLSKLVRLVQVTWFYEVVSLQLTGDDTSDHAALVVQ